MPADAKLKKKIKGILAKVFPGETVDVSDGLGTNIHVVVVSGKFKGKREKQKQEMLWGAIDKSILTDAEKVKISLILPYSPSDLK